MAEETKNLAYWQQQVAEKYGCERWGDLYYRSTVLRTLPTVATIFEEAAELYANHCREEGKKEGIASVPYQCCPVCNGQGKVLSDGFTSAVYTTCMVCNGNKIIVPFIIDNKKGE